MAEARTPVYGLYKVERDEIDAVIEVCLFPCALSYWLKEESKTVHLLHF